MSKKQEKRIKSIPKSLKIRKKDELRETNHPLRDNYTVKKPSTYDFQCDFSGIPAVAGGIQAGKDLGRLHVGENRLVGGKKSGQGIVAAFLDLGPGLEAGFPDNLVHGLPRRPSSMRRRSVAVNTP